MIYRLPNIVSKASMKILEILSSKHKIVMDNESRLSNISSNIFAQYI